jgi:hypothetical protein
VIDDATILSHLIQQHLCGLCDHGRAIPHPAIELNANIVWVPLTPPIEAIVVPEELVKQQPGHCEGLIHGKLVVSFGHVA